MTNHRTNHRIKAFVSLVFVLIIINFSLSQGPPPEWIIYNTSNSGLPENYVSAIAIDGQGNKWIGTARGLAKFDGLNWTVYNTSNSGLPYNNVYAIAIDGEGNKWIGTYVGGLAKFDGSSWTVYTTSNSGLPSDYVYAIAIDGQGNKWIGTSRGLAKFDGRNWTVYNTSNSGLLSNWVLAIAIDGQGNKWIGTGGGGLAKFDGSSWTVYKYRNSLLPSDTVYAIAIDGGGNIWIGTRNGGLAKFDGVKTWIVYDTSNSGLPYNDVRAIAIDGGGNIWIGTYSGGLAKFDGVNWTVYKWSNSGLPDNYVFAIAIDGWENKWIGTVGGLAVYREGGVYIPIYPKILSIRDVPNDQGGKVLIRWLASSLDTNVNKLTHYTIWRAIPQPQTKFNQPNKSYRVRKFNGITYFWENIGSQPAHKLQYYAFTAQTLYDSMSTTDGKHYFFISAHTYDPNVFYDSFVDSGYSVDNLAPLPPRRVASRYENGAVLLTWDHNSETDLRGYLIYRSDKPGIDIYKTGPIATTRDSFYIDRSFPTSGRVYYVVAAQDIHDNISSNNSEVEIIITSVSYENETPKSFILYQNYPNPFNPATTIEFDIPERTQVKLIIHDALGYEIKVLLDKDLEPGKYKLNFDARDLPSGVYFYTLRTPKFTKTNKMLLIK
jgi:streptogramin lyase